MVLAALRNALRVVDKRIEDVRRRHVRGRAPPARRSCGCSSRPALSDVVVCDVDGVVHAERGDTDESLRWIADNTNRGGLTGGAEGRHARCRRLHRRVALPTCSTPTTSPRWPTDAIVFALANPDPEIDPVVARQHAAVVATGRSDHPNQINNVLAFPGVFRGLLDAQSHGIDTAVLLAAANAIASTVADDELNANYIIPSVFHPDVHTKVAAAVRDAARR